MSWAEIKKAVNSRMAEMPLDDMFGLQFVREVKATTTPTSLSGFDGLLWLYTGYYSGGVGSYIELADGSGQYRNRYIYLSQDTQPSAIVPINKNQTFYVAGVNGAFRIFSWGGGIS